jgi:hypothetical protein
MSVRGCRFACGGALASAPHAVDRLAQVGGIGPIDGGPDKKRPGITRPLSVTL